MFIEIPRADLPQARPATRRPHYLRCWVVRGTQLAVFVFAGMAAFLLRFDFAVPSFYRLYLGPAICAWMIAKIVAFHLFGLASDEWKYFSVRDVLRLAIGNLAGSSLACAALLIFGPPGFPRSVFVLDFTLCLMLTAGVRLVVRAGGDIAHINRETTRKHALIYGAGDAGVNLLREIRGNLGLDYQVDGFVDDNPDKHGHAIQSVKVLGGGASLRSIVGAMKSEIVLIAAPSATGAQMTSILRHCHEAGIPFKTVPSLAELMESPGRMSQVREVAADDLLGRKPVRLDERVIRAKLENQVVLVTGAAGSIGSELCRQIARFSPAAIVGLDIAETALFYLDRGMRESFPGLSFYAEVGDIRNPRRLAEVFERYRPSVLYHAAAYKHVPVMERHAFEAVENNVIGTWNVAMAAARFEVADCVLISTDKAVHPTSVMGVTKRAAELLIRAAQNGGPNYVSVRFGNVLGSNGSVAALFKQQIAARKPITITHPDMRRYFMTIPEAAQLVLQASSLGRGGEIFVLDMGEPVRILDLARNLILLSGLRPDEDIKVEFTGIRPGEKLDEELVDLTEKTRPTFHEKIRIFAGNGFSESDARRHVENLRRLSAARDLPRLILELKTMVPEYKPSPYILRSIAKEERETVCAIPAERTA